MMERRQRERLRCARAQVPLRPNEQRADHERPRTASYEADPAQVRRVLLLYSGGLDTSVMLKWIQERYEAEVVTLTVNLGQPDEDYAAIRARPTARRARVPRGRRARGVRRTSTSRARSRRTRSTAAATRCSRRSGGR